MEAAFERKPQVFRAGLLAHAGLRDAIPLFLSGSWLAVRKGIAAPWLVAGDVTRATDRSELARVERSTVDRWMGAYRSRDALRHEVFARAGCGVAASRRGERGGDGQAAGSCRAHSGRIRRARRLG